MESKQKLPPLDARQIVISEIEGTFLTEQFVDDALNCADHAVIADSVMLGVAYRIARRLEKAEALNAAHVKRIGELSEALREYRDSHVDMYGCFDEGLGGIPTSTDYRCPTCKSADALLAAGTKETE